MLAAKSWETGWFDWTLSDGSALPATEGWRNGPELNDRSYPYV